jgi:hypothetical protein
MPITPHFQMDQKPRSDSPDSGTGIALPLKGHGFDGENFCPTSRHWTPLDQRHGTDGRLIFVQTWIRAKQPGAKDRRDGAIGASRG